LFRQGLFFAVIVGGGGGGSGGGGGGAGAYQSAHAKAIFSEKTPFKVHQMYDKYVICLTNLYTKNTKTENTYKVSHINVSDKCQTICYNPYMTQIKEDNRVSLRLSPEDMEIINKLLPEHGNSISKVIKACIHLSDKMQSKPANQELGISIYQDQAVAMGYEPNTKGIQYFLNNAITCFAKRKEGKEIPYFKVTKNEIADFLGISQLDKRWGTFMDNIEKYYYER